MRATRLWLVVVLSAPAWLGACLPDSMVEDRSSATMVSLAVILENQENAEKVAARMEQAWLSASLRDRELRDSLPPGIAADLADEILALRTTLAMVRSSLEEAEEHSPGSVGGPLEAFLTTHEALVGLLGEPLGSLDVFRRERDVLVGEFESLRGRHGSALGLSGRDLRRMANELELAREQVSLEVARQIEEQAARRLADERRMIEEQRRKEREWQAHLRRQEEEQRRLAEHRQVVEDRWRQERLGRAREQSEEGPGIRLGPAGPPSGSIGQRPTGDRQHQEFREWYEQHYLVEMAGLRLALGSFIVARRGGGEDELQAACEGLLSAVAAADRRRLLASPDHQLNRFLAEVLARMDESGRNCLADHSIERDRAHRQTEAALAQVSHRLRGHGYSLWGS